MLLSACAWHLYQGSDRFRLCLKVKIDNLVSIRFHGERGNNGNVLIQHDALQLQSALKEVPQLSSLL